MTKSSIFRRAGFGRASLALWAAALTACGGGAGTAAPQAESGAAPTSAVPAAGTDNAGTTGAAVGHDENLPVRNVASLRVDAGLDGRQINKAYVSVTVCTPGSDACQVIDHVVVDTGSSGLRVAAGALKVPLPPHIAPDGGQLAECATFVSGFSWGQVRKADVRVAGEVAAGIPIQVVNDPAVALPDTCRAKGIDLGVPAGSNGILGVGMQATDCGAFCETDASPELYFSCQASGRCDASVAPRPAQVANPVASFATNNNGVALRLPSVPPGGATALDGKLVFGIGTQANNQLGAATIVRAEAPSGLMWTLYKGMSYPSFIDSGSNGMFLADSSIPACADAWFCPPQPVRLSAHMIEPAENPRSIPMELTIEGVQQIAAAATAGNIGGSSADWVGWYFVWGLPFYFGRTVFTAIDGAGTPAGAGTFLGVLIQLAMRHGCARDRVRAHAPAVIPLSPGGMKPRRQRQST